MNLLFDILYLFINYVRTAAEGPEWPGIILNKPESLNPYVK